MRTLVLIGMALFVAHGAQAQPAPSAACLAPAAAGEGPVTIRDAKFGVYETTVAGNPATKQTVVTMQACAMITGTANAYALSYRPVLFSADGHLLQGGTAVNNLRVVADDPVKGGAAHAVISENFTIGYAIDHSKIARTVLITALAAGTCTALPNGVCAPLPPDTQVRTITIPTCLADGAYPPPVECPAGVTK